MTGWTEVTQLADVLLTATLTVANLAAWAAVFVLLLNPGDPE